MNTANINRIVGNLVGKNNSSSNNYALNTMAVQVNGNNVPITSHLDSASGLSMPMNSLQSLAFYTNLGNWLTTAWSIDSVNAIWKICDGQDLPFLRWQGLDCPVIIIATAGAGGTINPAGTVIVEEGEDQKFTFTPDNCYEIDEVLIDGTNNPTAVTAGSYTFNNITANHTIAVSFKKIEYFTQIKDSISAGSSYIFNGKTLTEAGIYYDTLQTIHGCDSIVELTLTISTVGIVGANNYSPLPRIYPNPTTGKLVVSGQLSDVSVEIYDVVGRKLSHFTSHNSQFTIDISHLANGMYFLKVDGKTVKIIKQ
jgi:hypothetical protein